ncbi:MAG: hypothetical protein CME62_02170 [Halobacteriovoraceae bacterium]|nr:hypothetical protein [Halobacteriovoraceae bacterium]
MKLANFKFFLILTLLSLTTISLADGGNEVVDTIEGPVTILHNSGDGQASFITGNISPELAAQANQEADSCANTLKNSSASDGETGDLPGSCTRISEVDGLQEHLDSLGDICGTEQVRERSPQQSACSFRVACPNSASSITNEIISQTCRSYIESTHSETGRNIANVINAGLQQDPSQSLADVATSKEAFEKIILETAKMLSGPGSRERFSGSLDIFNGQSPSRAGIDSSVTFGYLADLCGRSDVWPSVRTNDESRDIKSPIAGDARIIDSWDNPYRMYGDYGSCTNVFDEGFFVGRSEASSARVLARVCKDLINIYSTSVSNNNRLEINEDSRSYQVIASDLSGFGGASSAVTISENQLKFFHYFGKIEGAPELGTDGAQEQFNQIYSANYATNIGREEVEARVVISNEVKTAAVKTFLSLISPCMGFRHIVEKVDDAYPDHNQGIVGVRGEIEQCFVRAGGQTSKPKSSLDFQDCRVALRWMGGDDIVGGALMPTATSAFGAIRQQDIAADASRDAANGDQTARLDQQRRTYLAQRDTHLINATTRASFGAGILNSAFSFSTPDNMTRKNCLQENINIEDNLGLQEDLYCATAKLAHYDPDIIPMLWTNQHMKDQLGFRAANTLTRALVDGIMAYVQNKNANSVQDVIDTFENAGFNQPENQVTVEPRNCVINPDDPRCPQSNLGRRPSTGGVDFQFSGTPQGGGNSGLDFISDEEFNTGDGVNSLTDGDLDSVADLSNIGSSNSDSKVGSGFDAPGAAGGRAAGSGAGGGGGGGAAGGGGGGGGGPAPEQAGGAPPADGNLGKKIAPKYLAGQDGGFRSAGSAKTANKKDPFAALRKKQQRGPSSVIDKSIMPKSSKLFEVISKRYAAAAKEGKIK